MPRKGYGRIYVLAAEDVETVKAIIKELDPFEFEYMPDDMVAPFSEYPRVVFTRKFDSLDLDALGAACFSRGVAVWALVASGDHADRPDDAYVEVV